MPAAALHDRLEALIDDLLAENDLETTSLASLLMTAQESWREGSIVPLSLMIRRTLQDQRGEAPSPAEELPSSLPNAALS